MIIRELPKTPIDITFKIIFDPICVRKIDKMAAISDIKVVETIDTKVSSATCFSVRDCFKVCVK